MTAPAWGEPADAPSDSKGADEKEKNYVIVPLVVGNPSIGNGGGVTGMYFFDKSDEEDTSPRSFLQPGALYTHTKSYVGWFMANHFSMNDSLRLRGGVAGGRINNDFEDPRGGNAKFAQDFRAIFFQGRYEVADELYLGAQAKLTSVDYDPKDSKAEEYLDLVGATNTTNAGIGPLVTYDTRDNHRYPSKGIYAEVRGFINPESWGNDDTYSKSVAELNHFVTLTEENVLASRAFFTTCSPDTPYSGQARLGKRSDIRGFKNGEIFGRTMLALQTEYRWIIASKWTLVPFVSVAKLWDDELDERGFLSHYYSGGLGIRYRVHESEKVNFRVDVAVGNERNSGIYFGIGEAF